jgi:hypothetical protein
VVIVEVVVDSGFFVYVEPFYGVEVRAFLVEVYYLQNVLYGAKGVLVFVQVSGKVGVGGVVAEGPFVLMVSGSEVSSSLPYVRHPTIGAGEFIHPRLGEWVAVVCVV